MAHSQLFAVAAVTIANESDNLGVYIPVFARTPTAIPVFVAACRRNTPGMSGERAIPSDFCRAGVSSGVTSGKNTTMPPRQPAPIAPEVPPC